MYSGCQQVIRSFLQYDLYFLLLLPVTTHQASIFDHTIGHNSINSVLKDILLKTSKHINLQAKRLRYV